MAKGYVMTAARKAALRKAQLASARKRRGRGKGKLARANRAATRNKRIAVVAATGGLALAATGVAGAYYAKKVISGGPKPRKINHSGNSRKKTMGVGAYSNSNVGSRYSHSNRGSFVIRKGNKRTRFRNRRRENAVIWGY